MVLLARFPSPERGLSFDRPDVVEALAALNPGQPVVIWVPGNSTGEAQVRAQAERLAERQEVGVIALSWNAGLGTAAGSIENGKKARTNGYGLLELLATLLHGDGLRAIWTGRPVSLVVHGQAAKLLKAAVLERPDLVGEMCTSVVLAAPDISYDLQIDWLARITPRQEPDAVSVLWHDGDAALDNLLDGRLLYAAREVRVPQDLLETQVGVFGDSDPFHAVPEFEYVDVSGWVTARDAQPWPEDAIHLSDDALFAADQRRASAVDEPCHTYVWTCDHPDFSDVLGRLITKGGAF